MTDKYAIYLRKSREDLKAEARGEGETLARHRKILTDYAARRGLFVEVIFEEIVSGETIADRPQIQKLISDCYAGKYKGILVKEVSRLSRGNQGDAQTILDCLKFGNHNTGVIVHTPTRVYDVAHSPDDEEYMEFELFMSRREYKMITKRLQDGRKQAVAEGQYIGSKRPYGYDIIEKDNARTLKPIPAEVPIVEKIFKWKVYDKMAAGAIARKLTAQGVPTCNGLPEWSRETVKQILKNPIYRGRVRWNARMTVKSMEDGELVTKRPKMQETEHYMEYDGLHDAIIPDDLFFAAQEGYYSDKTKASYTLQNIFAGLLVCQKCGLTMVHYGRKSSPGARRRIYHKPSQMCKVKSAFYSDIVEAFVYGLKQYIEDFEVMIDNKPDVDESEVEEQIRALEAEKRKTERILAKIFDDYENELYTPNEFVSRKAKHNERLDAISKEIRELERAIPDREEYQEKVVTLHNAIDMILDENIPSKIKNEFLKEFVDRVEFSRENGEQFTLDIFLY